MKLSDLTPQQRARLARLARMADGSLRHLAAGRRQASAETAATIEAAARRMGLDIPRESMCAACRRCVYLHQAKGKS